MQVLSRYENLKNPPPNVIASEKHCSTCVFRLNKEMKSMPSSTQTGGSTEADAGVFKHEKKRINRYKFTTTGYQLMLMVSMLVLK